MNFRRDVVHREALMIGVLCGALAVWSCRSTDEPRPDESTDAIPGAESETLAAGDASSELDTSSGEGVDARALGDESPDDEILGVLTLDPSDPDPADPDDVAAPAAEIATDDDSDAADATESVASDDRTADRVDAATALLDEASTAPSADSSASDDIAEATAMSLLLEASAVSEAERAARERAAEEARRDREARDLLARVTAARGLEGIREAGAGAVLRGDDAPAPATDVPAPPTGETAESADALANAAAKPAEGPPAGDAAAAAGDAPAPKAGFQRAGPFSFHVELFHKRTPEIEALIRETYPEWIDEGRVYKVPGKDRDFLIFSEKPIAEDPLGQQIVKEIEVYDRLGLEIHRRVIRPRYIDVEVLMKAMVMAGVCNIYELTDEQDVLTWKEGNKNRSATRQIQSYIQTGMVQGAASPLGVPEDIPFIYELGKEDSFEVPKQYSGRPRDDRVLVAFENTASAEERGGLMAVGTTEDLERIQAFVDSVDVPARQIMIEVQVIELDANKLSDFGLDSIQFGSGHHIGQIALPLPGEGIVQPGLGSDVRADPEQFVPDVMFEGFDFAFDDTSVDLTGRFLTRLRWLVREGDATIKARPKILTLSDRTSVLHIGREEPVFESTGVIRDVTNGNLVNEIRKVTTQYVGFTLNIRPRITGGVEDEVTLQMEVIVNELGARQRVFEEDLAGIPEIITRHFVGMPRVKNHRPIVLGGLIQEQEVESVNKIPLLADIPLLGYLFRRTQKSQSRNEIILVVTPHILSETGVDQAATPKESVHFDTFDSVLFNDRHVLKGSDVIGIDPVNKVPVASADGRVFTEDEVVDLTLANVVKKRELVSKLDIFESYLGAESSGLSWIQRRWPERSVADWPADEQEIYFRAAAIVLENIKELNGGLTYDDIVLPRREIMIPTSPYRISLSYDRVRALQELGTEEILRDGRVELTQEIVELLHEGKTSHLANFADFLETKERQAEDHGELLAELETLYSRLVPRGKDLSKLDYPEVYRVLDDANIDFVTIETFFQTNLAEKYALSGAPDVGLFGVDLQAFLESSLSLRQRAKRLRELHEKWYSMNGDS